MINAINAVFIGGPLDGQQKVIENTHVYRVREYPTPFHLGLHDSLRGDNYIEHEYHRVKFDVVWHFHWLSTVTQGR